MIVTASTTPIMVNGDPARVTQVFGNLLNNAAEFTDTGGHVWVDVRAEQDTVTITVRDDGVGITPAPLHRVFEMFEQLDASAERSKGGVGLGLPLVKTLVELHGERFM